ncbi:MAG TPA: DUF5060 domain-containing protein [Clostridiaceae bacterium]|nr:DUF5060 domain-containing protein [Clostridiaceae bacterium]
MKPQYAIEGSTGILIPMLGLMLFLTRPDNSKIHFWGFYDGDDVWKIRCMPDMIGPWKFEAAFSDGAGCFSDSFECISSDIPEMISRDETNPLWFGFKGGKHVLIRSFHVGDRFFAENWPDSERRKFIKWARKQGYNMFSIASHYLNRRQAGRGLGWKTPELWPLNANEYRKMEKILDELAKENIMVFPFAGFFGRASLYPTNHNDQINYIKYTLARLSSYWNIVFNVAGPEPVHDTNPYMTKEEVRRLGMIIKKLNVFGHLISVHNQPGDDEYKDEEFTTFSTLQGPKTVDRSLLYKGLLANHSRLKPLFAQETLWPGNVIGHPEYTEEDIRKNAIVIMMSAAALNFADMNGDSSSGFSGTLKLEDRVQLRHDIVKKVWDFFETIPFYRLSPCPHLADNGYCLAEPGVQYLVYLENGGTVNISVANGNYSVEWINARDTSERILSGYTCTGSGLTSPDSNDWFVYLRLCR